MSFQIVPAAAVAASNSDASAASGPASSSASQTLADWWAGVSKSLKTLQPNRLQFVDVAAAPKVAPKAAPQLAVPVAAPRFSMWVLDLPPPPRAQDTRAAVLVLPQGREVEWQFRSITGGSELARQHGFHRVIFVALNRGQVFTGLEQVKAELTPLLRAFQPQEMPGAMQIVSLGSDVGARREVFRLNAPAVDGAAASAGALVVEDVLVGSTHVHRRLLFEGSGLVQSEARLNVQPSFLTMTAAQRKAKMKKKKQAAAAAKKKEAGASKEESATQEDGEDGGEEEEDASAAATAAAAAANSSSSLPLSCTPSPSGSLICYSYLPCEYQHGLLTMLALLPTPVRTMVLIGLGGGSLTMFLSRSQPQLDLHVVELDQSVVDSAHRFFGFQEERRTTSAAGAGGRLVCHVEDGLKFIEKLAKRIAERSSGAEDSEAKELSSLSIASSSTVLDLPSTPQDVVLIDVNNVDLADGLSFPPPSFLEATFLAQVKACLTRDGWLLLNLGCRNAPLREQLLGQIGAAFQRVYVLQPDEEYVNFIVAATNAPVRAQGEAAESEQELTWEEAEQRLRHLQSPPATASSTPAFKSLVWDKEMADECHEALARIQQMQVCAQSEAGASAGAGVGGSIQLRYLFPAQRAAQEAEKE